MIIVVLIVALVFGGLLGSLMIRDAGYVLVTYADLTLETSVWVALISLVLIGFLAWFIVYLFGRLLRGRSGVARWIGRRRRHGARQLTVRGVLLMAEGQWGEAKKVFESAVSRSETPLINYLSAARAAQELGQVDERDRLLQLARETTPGSRFAVLLTQAQLQKDKAQWDQCRATLIELKHESPKHPMVLEMMLDCYMALEDWTALTELIPVLKKTKVLDPDRLHAMQVEVWKKRMTASRASEDVAKHAENTFGEMPKDLKKEPALVMTYAKLLIEGGENDAAETALRRSIAANWSEDTVRQYGLVQSSNPAKQLAVAEDWLKQRPNNAVVLLALGRICLMNEQWNDARKHFEASLRLTPSSEVNGELGRLCLALGEAELGGQYLAQSVAGAELPELPLPSQIQSVA